MSTQAAGRGASAAWRLAALAALGVFFAADDQTSVVAVLPAMIDDLGLTQDEFYRAAWLINGYILGYVAVMPLMGRAADAFGHGRVYALAMLLFCIGSALVALSTNLTAVTAARAVQAVGAGAVRPVAMAIVTTAVPTARRPLALGAIAATAEAGALFGPLWGGSITSLLGWQWVFWINLPMCLPIAAAIWLLAPSRASGDTRGIDLPGALLLGVSLAALAIALTDDPIRPRSTGVTLALLTLAALVFGGFVWRQLRAPLPMIDLSMLRQAPLSAALLANCLLGGALLVALVNVPLFTNTVLGGSALEGGLNLMRLSVGLAIGAALGGVLAQRFGLAAVASVGAALAAAGYAGAAQWDASPGFLALTAPLFLSGLGFGLTLSPLSTAVIDHAPEAERATWAAILTVARLVGALISVALLTSRGLSGFYAEAGLVALDDPRFREILERLQVEAYQDTFLLAAAVCFAAVLPCLLLRRRS